jgi:hypothetical protein
MAQCGIFGFGQQLTQVASITRWRGSIKMDYQLTPHTHSVKQVVSILTYFLIISAINKSARCLLE